MTISQVLDVPYLTQPTGKTCQSTCLSMFAKFLEKRLGVSTRAGSLSVQEIWDEINKGMERPSKEKNSYLNMQWWLSKYFSPPFKFGVASTKSVDEAIDRVVAHIDLGFPVMVSTNQERTDGPIILVIGYEGYSPAMSGPDIRFICHDPYGKFAPQLHSNQYAKKRFEDGMSLVSGGEVGAGKDVRYDYQGIRRIRTDKHSSGTFFMISGTP